MVHIESFGYKIWRVVERKHLKQIQGYDNHFEDVRYTKKWEEAAGRSLQLSCNFVCDVLTINLLVNADNMRLVLYGHGVHYGDHRTRLFIDPS